MRKVLTIIVFTLLAQPALAESLSPIQQYLQGEAGYMPQQAQRPAVQPAPYYVAQTPVPNAVAAMPVPESTDNSGQINSGVRGMNF